MSVVQTRSAQYELFERFLLDRSASMPETDQALLRAAFEEAERMYEHQTHWTGENMLEHCMGVLRTYSAFNPDDESVVACLLHHALDGKDYTLDMLEKRHGASVRSMVSGVHLLSHVTMENKRMSLHNLRLMLVRVSTDMRVVLLILCDHTYQLKHMNMLAPDAQKRISRDVLNLFAPVAARLGIYSLKHQMEALAFPVAHPVDASRIAEQIAQIHRRHGYFLDKVAETLHASLKEAGINATLEGREKQAFSIFQKMRTKSVMHVEDMYDLFALRVIVSTEAECYQALGVLHRMGHPVARRFKDYIAFPKPNGYQSLHTTLAQLPGVPEGMCLEVQIRTVAMHREADLGVAAHWSYKQGHAADRIAQREKLQKAFAASPQEKDPQSAADHIFVLTPNGDLMELAEGATPLDFAFNVHSMLGLCFKHARVNGHIVPLNYQLENGDIVEIIRGKEPHPSANWMTVLKTSSAKSRLKQYLASLNRPAFVQSGRQALNIELARHSLPALDPDLTLMRSVDGHILSLTEREDILMSIGQKAQTASSIFMQLDAVSADQRLPIRPSEQHLSVAPVARVEGDIPLPVRFARCCKADEGERGVLSGVIGRDGVVRVHREECKMLRQANPERRIGATWDGDE